MVKWEYKIETKNSKGLDEFKYLSEMGMDGWELVSVLFMVTSAAGFDYYNYYFKKPVQQ